MRTRVPARAGAVLLAMLVGGAVTRAAPPAADAPGQLITIYQPRSNPLAARAGGGAGAAQSQPFAVVTDRRQVAVEAGEARFPGVPATLDPASVHLRDLTDPSAQPLEQWLEHDLASPDALLAKHLGQPITVVTAAGEVSGVLRWFDAGGLLLEGQGGALTLLDRRQGVRDVKLGPTPGGLVSEPTLRWRLRSKKPGPHLIEATYTVTGLSWQADYAVVLDAKGQKVDLSAWITLENATGAALSGIVRLVSGGPGSASATAAAGQQAAYGQGGTGAPIELPEQAAHVYALPAVTLPPGSKKQVDLMASPEGLVARPIYLFEYTPRYAYAYVQQGYPFFDQGQDAYTPLKFDALGSAVEIELKGHAPADLPPGRARVYRRDAQGGALALLAEDEIAHTPRDGALLVRTGTSGDVTVERKVTLRIDDRTREMFEKVEIRFKSSRKEVVWVVVSEPLWRWRYASVEQPSSPATISDDGLRAGFRIKVPASGEATLVYTARYHTW